MNAQRKPGALASGFCVKVPLKYSGIPACRRGALSADRLKMTNELDQSANSCRWVGGANFLPALMRLHHPGDQLVDDGRHHSRQDRGTDPSADDHDREVRYQRVGRQGNRHEPADSGQR
jgi:hypothetical protein